MILSAQGASSTIAIATVYADGIFSIVTPLCMNRSPLSNSAVLHRHAMRSDGAAGTPALACPVRAPTVELVAVSVTSPQAMR